MTVTPQAWSEYVHNVAVESAIGGRRPKDDGPRLRGLRVTDPHYCAPCGILFADVCDAQRHRREDHPEQAHYERLRAAVALDERTRSTP